MVSVISTKNSEYNEFFSKVIDSLDQYFDNPPRLLIVALPDGEVKEPHFSTYGVDTYDLMDISALCQHEAYKYLVYDACSQYMETYFDDCDESEDGEFDDFDEFNDSDGQTVR